MKINDLGLSAVGTWLPERTASLPAPEGGTVTVHRAAPEDTTYAMAEYATRDALRRADLPVSALEGQHYLVCNEAPPDYLIQQPGRQIADRLGLGRVHSFNFTQGGNSALMALYLLASHMALDPTVTRGAVSAPQHWEYHSKDRLLGDAVLSDGSAVLLAERAPARNRLLSVATRTIGRFHDVLYTEVGGWAVPMTEEPCREGRFVYRVHNADHYREVRRVTLDVLSGVIDRALDEADTTWDALDRVVLDTATPSLRADFQKRFDVADDTIVDSGRDGAWMNSTGLLYALGRLLDDRSLPPGSKALITSVGVDGNWAAAVMEV